MYLKLYNEEQMVVLETDNNEEIESWRFDTDNDRFTLFVHVETNHEVNWKTKDIRFNFNNNHFYVNNVAYKDRYTIGNIKLPSDENILRYFMIKTNDIVNIEDVL